MLLRTRYSLVRLVSELKGEIRGLKGTVTSQRERLSKLETGGQSSIHSMEVEQHNQKQREVKRRDPMTDGELRSDLEKQYGTTNWARKLINGLLAKRRREAAENDS